MKIAILTIGDELLNGDLVDSNISTLSRYIREVGLKIEFAQTLPDDRARIAQALGELAPRVDLLLVTGGLGPTTDDVTLTAAADAASVPLVIDLPTLASIEARFAARGFSMPPNNRRQAEVPEGSDVFPNPAGTAPHVQLTVTASDHSCRLLFFPGVPRELAELIPLYLAPYLAAHAPVRPTASSTLRTFGKTESQVGALLEALPTDPRIHVAYRATFPEIQVTFHATEPDPATRSALLSTTVARARAALGVICFSDDRDVGLAARVLALLRARGETLALAESCTGGLASSLITDVPGASDVFLGGLVTYANSAKVQLIGVPDATLAEAGAVSEATARAMAEGVRRVTGASWGVAITGIAGPGGGSPEKPVGLVHFAATSNNETITFRRTFPFTRDQVRQVAAWTALDLLRRALLSAKSA